MTGRRVVLLVAVFLTGLSAGFFFTYEASVTRGLAEVDDSTYVATFQAINRTIRNPWFAIVFFGAVPAIAAALVGNWQSSAVVRWLVGGGLALYLASIAITGTGNVPLNNNLAELEDINPVAAAQARNDFEADWNRLNLIRAIGVTTSFALLATALGLPATSEEDADGQARPTSLSIR